MNLKELEISSEIFDFIKKNRSHFNNLKRANLFLKGSCGIINFFDTSNQLDDLRLLITEKENIIQEEPDRREYGDFQTNKNLALKSVQYILSMDTKVEFDYVVEPTCGKGSFILAALSQIETLKKVIGIEIYQPYIWKTKFKILEFYIQNPQRTKPEIEIIHANVFDFDFEKLSNETRDYTTLVIGNPPWVTNSELGSIDSENLPQKSNFKKHRGFDAITGKGNFDIGEYIALMILRNFSSHNGYFGFLIKNAVVKNLLYDQKHNNFRISKIEKLNIDSTKEFNVSVDACLFLAKLNKEPEFSCMELDFYTKEKRTSFGWFNDSYVYSISDYQEANDIEGKSQFIWRQGIKHDCSKVMEIERYNDHFKNGLDQEVEIENDLVFGLLKSSDLKVKQTNSYRKLTIITQKKIGQNTDYIHKDYPLTFEYLWKNKDYFDKRKSSIYKGKSNFSIFGVGDYSFMPYKVAVSGLYKSTHFTLVLPENGKPIMLDDTCYFISFNKLPQARIAHYLLNHEHTQQFLKAIIFPDSKRSITKDVLMRINFHKLYSLFDPSSVQNDLDAVTLEEWEAFGELTGKKQGNEQMTLF